MLSHHTSQFNSKLHTIKLNCEFNLSMKDNMQLINLKSSAPELSVVYVHNVFFLFAHTLSFEVICSEGCHISYLICLWILAFIIHHATEFFMVILCSASVFNPCLTLERVLGSHQEKPWISSVLWCIMFFSIWIMGLSLQFDSML